MKADYMASVNPSRKTLLAEIATVGDVSRLMASIGYKFISGLMECDQNAGLEDLGHKVYEIEGGHISSRGQTFHLFSASPPLDEGAIKEAKRQNIGLYKVEKL